MMRLTLAFLLLAALPPAHPAGTCQLTVRILGFRSAKGNGGAALFRGPKGFPRHDEDAILRAPGPIENGISLVHFRDVPPGNYAVGAIHDENANGKLDSNFLGIPKEGFGVSNNPHVGLREPSYQSAEFNLAGEKEIEIRLIYK